jgi:hypothetical protein
LRPQVHFPHCRKNGSSGLRALPTFGTKTRVMIKSTPHFTPFLLLRIAQTLRAIGAFNYCSRKLKFYAQYGLSKTGQKKSDSSRDMGIRSGARVTINAHVPSGRNFPGREKPIPKNGRFSRSSGKYPWILGHKWEHFSCINQVVEIHSPFFIMLMIEYTISYIVKNYASLHNESYRTLPYLCGLAGMFWIPHRLRIR